MISHDTLREIEKIDEQMIDLLSQRMMLCQEALEEDEDALGAEYHATVISHWEGAADERGWSTAVLGKICRAVMEFCKTGGE